MGTIEGGDQLRQWIEDSYGAAQVSARLHIYLIRKYADDPEMVELLAESADQVAVMAQWLAKAHEHLQSQNPRRIAALKREAKKRKRKQ